LSIVAQQTTLKLKGIRQQYSSIISVDSVGDWAQLCVSVAGL
jgi:hypothetical protein